MLSRVKLQLQQYRQLVASDRRDSLPRKAMYCLAGTVFMLWLLSAISSTTMLWQHTGVLKNAFVSGRGSCETIDDNPNFPYWHPLPARGGAKSPPGNRHLTTSAAISGSANTMWELSIPSGNSGVARMDRELGRLYRIGIVCLYEQDNAKFRHSNAPKAAWSAELVSRLIDNRKHYAQLHNAKYGSKGTAEYVVIEASLEVDHTRPTAWSKLLALRHHLADYDYLFYIDMDVVIMRPDVQLDGIINLANKMHREIVRRESKQPEAEVEPPDLILTADHNGPNTGLFFLRNSPFSFWLLDELWSCSEGLSFPTPKLGPPLPHSEETAEGKQKDKGFLGLGIGGRVYPFEYEQRAFHYLLQTDVWTRRSLPIYKGDVHSTAFIRSRTAVLPQCTMNSYSVHPLAWLNVLSPTPNAYAADYVHGVDFAVHLAGYKGRIKVDMLEHYLEVSLAEERGRAKEFKRVAATK